MQSSGVWMLLPSGRWQGLVQRRRESGDWPSLGCFLEIVVLFSPVPVSYLWCLSSGSLSQVEQNVKGYDIALDGRKQT